MMAAPTERPWRVTPNPERSRTWIEGPEGSGDVRLAEKDRRIVVDATLYGDDAFDAETRENLRLIARLANEDAGFAHDVSGGS